MGPFDDLTAAQRQQIREAHATRKETDPDRRWREGVALNDAALRAEARLARQVAEDAAAYVPPPVLTCPVCERSDITTKKDGTLRVHGSKQGWPPSNCTGSGMKPKEG